MSNRTAKELHDLIFSEGRTYGDDGADHLCDYTEEQRIQFIEEYANSKQSDNRELIEFGEFLLNMNMAVKYKLHPSDLPNLLEQFRKKPKQ